jgi:hypothetical protein
VAVNSIYASIIPSYKYNLVLKSFSYGTLVMGHPVHDFVEFKKVLYKLCCVYASYSLFFPGRRVRAHLQNPATKCDFPIGYFIFLLILEKCAILQCSVLSIRSKLPFLFHRVLIFLSCFVCFFVCFVSIYLFKKNSS